MSNIEIFFLAVGRAMDAFAVSICKGLAIKKTHLKESLVVGTYFGFFQALMPLIGYLLAFKFKDMIMNIDHWIAFVFLSLIGINMIFEKETEKLNNEIGFKQMIIAAIATSIDALVVGITMSFLNVNILKSAILIGIVTFILSAIGIKIGNIFGNKYERRAKIVGGIILIVIGFKTLIEHIM